MAKTNDQQNIASSCSFCRKSFRSNSKPSQCTKCSLSFHRSKTNNCFNLHACYQHTPQNVHGRSVDQNHRQTLLHVEPGTSSDPVRMTAITTEASLSVTSTPAAVVSSAPSVPLPTSTQSRSVTFVPSAVSTLSSSVNASTLNPTETNPGQSSQQPHTHTRPSQSKQNKKGANQPPISPQEAEIEYLKVELNNARTEIVKLDNEIEDYKKKMTVLNARVKILADRENERLHGQYFPDSVGLSPHSSHCSRSCHTWPRQCCCNTPSTQASQSQPAEGQVHSSMDMLTKSIEEISTDLKEIKKNFANVAAKQSTRPESVSLPARTAMESSGMSPIAPSDIEEFAFGTENEINNLN